MTVIISYCIVGLNIILIMTNIKYRCREFQYPYQNMLGSNITMNAYCIQGKNSGIRHQLRRTAVQCMCPTFFALRNASIS